MDIKRISDSIKAEAKKIIVGKDDQIKLITMAILAGGHVLLDDLPGVGKTTLVKTMAIALGCDFGRIQFVPDLLPSDIVGMNIFNQKTGEFELRQGPIMTNVLLADEINRAIPRTQSALLEAMEEGQVSIDRKIIPLQKPFIVLATQNPVESESTFRLPAAQMDRFLICLKMGYPAANEEIAMLNNLGDRIPFDSVKKVTDGDELVKAMEEIAKVHVSESLLEYMIAIINATRDSAMLKLGASPRASRGLYKAAKVWAAMEGRDYVIPDDVKALAVPVLAHRVMLKNNTGFSGTSKEKVIADIIDSIDSVPKIEALANEK